MDLSISQGWTNDSAVGNDFGRYEWGQVTALAELTIKELENNYNDVEFEVRQKDEVVRLIKYRIQYYASLTVMHTQPLPSVTYCQAYNLIASVVLGGDFLIFGDWCLYYGLSEAQFIERYKTDKELQLVWMFFDTLYNKLASLKIIDNNTLKRYESSRASGYFLPYTEKAVIADTVSRTQSILDRGASIARQLMGE